MAPEEVRMQWFIVEAENKPGEFARHTEAVADREVSAVMAELEDMPGKVADAARRLGDAGVNIELLAPLGMSGQKVTVAIGVDKVEEARTALGDLVSAGATA